MIEDLRVIASHRSYEFHPDALLLSLITTQPIQQLLASTFAFSQVQIGPPMATVAPVLQTIPPGLVFNYGYIAAEPGQPTPIRFLHFEPNRIVIDVAGESRAIDDVFVLLQRILGDVGTPDSVPAMGQPRETLDASECTFQSSDLLSKIVPNAVVESFRSAMRDRSGSVTVVPSLKLQLWENEESFSPTSALIPRQTASLELRSETRPADWTFFSAASLPSDEHERYLQALASNVLTSR